MGKWASYNKRGSAPFGGIMAAPAGADWSVGTITTTSIAFTRIAAIPTGATTMLGRAINNVTNVPATAFTGSPITGLTTLTAYRVQVAWFNGSIQVSDPSPAVLVSTV